MGGKDLTRGRGGAREPRVSIDSEYVRSLKEYINERHTIELEMAKQVRAVQRCIDELKSLFSSRVEVLKAVFPEREEHERLASAEICLARGNSWRYFEDLEASLNERAGVTRPKRAIDAILRKIAPAEDIALLLDIDLESLKRQRRKHRGKVE